MFGQKKESDKFELLSEITRAAGKLAKIYEQEGNKEVTYLMEGIWVFGMKEMINELEETV